MIIKRHDIELRHGIWKDKTETTNLHIQVHNVKTKKLRHEGGIYTGGDTRS